MKRPFIDRKMTKCACEMCNCGKHHCAHHKPKNVVVRLAEEEEGYTIVAFILMERDCHFLTNDLAIACVVIVYKFMGFV